MLSQYAIQHEFDHETTYVVHDSDTKLKDQDRVAFGSNLPVALRLRLAGLIRDELNRVSSALDSLLIERPRRQTLAHP